jgi:hypothetical protein
MMLVRDFITLALKNSGVLGTGQTPGAEMTNTALQTANAMIGQWAAKRWLVYHLVNIAHTSTGAVSYTVGPAGDFNCAIRPTSLEAAFVSQNLGTPQQIDTPLAILTAREDYNRIAMKSLISFPYWVYYDNAFPLGTLYPWPAPNATLYGLTITVKMVLSAFANLSDDINLPAEYQEALIYNLAIRMRALYQMAADPEIVALAKSALNTIRNANAQVPMLQMPLGMSRGGRYNIYSDQGR